MSFVIFEGDFIPSKVEVAGVEPASKQGTPELSTRLAGRFILLLEPGRRQPNPSPSPYISRGNRGTYHTISKLMIPHNDWPLKSGTTSRDTRRTTALGHAIKPIYPVN